MKINQGEVESGLTCKQWGSFRVSASPPTSTVTCHASNTPDSRLFHSNRSLVLKLFSHIPCKYQHQSLLILIYSIQARYQGTNGDFTALARDYPVSPWLGVFDADKNPLSWPMPPLRHTSSNQKTEKRTPANISVPSQSDRGRPPVPFCTPDISDISSFPPSQAKMLGSNSP